MGSAKLTPSLPELSPVPFPFSDPNHRKSSLSKLCAYVMTDERILRAIVAATWAVYVAVLNRAMPIPPEQ
jgi:hypothetical protein